MPRRREARGDEDVLTDMIVDDLDTSVNYDVAESGTPPNMSAAGDAKKISLWGKRDPKVDENMLREILSTTGLGDEAQAMLICQEQPKLLPLYAAPVQDPVLLDTLIDLATWPFRPGLWAHLEPDERVAESNRLDRLWQATLPPQPVAPEMPATPVPQPMEPPVPQPQPTPAASMPPSMMLGG
jgi:hypothetical protein